MKKVKILLVEDNEGDIFLTLEAFEESNIPTEIQVVRNGGEAMDYLFQRGKYIEAERPDLILLDVNLPVLNGHEILKAIKDDINLKIIPVIMLTTSSAQKDINSAYMNHANSYVTKPLEMEEFIDAVQKIEEFWLQLSKLAR